jgi:hypothetical protein
MTYETHEEHMRKLRRRMWLRETALARRRYNDLIDRAIGKVIEAQTACAPPAGGLKP